MCVRKASKSLRFKTISHKKLRHMVCYMCVIWIMGTDVLWRRKIFDGSLGVMNLMATSGEGTVKFGGCQTSFHNQTHNLATEIHSNPPQKTSFQLISNRIISCLMSHLNPQNFRIVFCNFNEMVTNISQSIIKIYVISKPNSVG